MDWKYLFTSYEGRINRAQFWAGVGVMIAISIVVNIIDVMVGTEGILGLIVGLAMLYFALAVYAKRWHDRDKSGWWSLIMLVPVIGFVWFLVECGILPGTQGANRFGPDPLA
ncbi:MAG: DUF805 domain-containing protein [Rhizobiaceae bacterium]